MASLKDAQKVTDELGGMVDELKSQLSEGNFDRLVQLSDDISERADGLADAFGSMNEALMSSLGDAAAGGRSKSQRSQAQRKSGGSRS
jgi:hypothetical protein